MELTTRTALLLALACAGAAAQSPPAPAQAVTTLPVVVADEPLTLPSDPLRIPPQGAVVLDAAIADDGTVAEVVTVEAPDAITGRAAADALRRWRFEPAMRGGRAVPVTARVIYPLGDSHPRGVSLDVAFTPGEGTLPPRVLLEVKPGYPAAAQREKVSGNVQLACVVLPDGTAADIRVTGPLEPSLDQAAVEALRKWRFAPGRRGSTAVPVRIEVEFAFTTQL